MILTSDVQDLCEHCIQKRKAMAYCWEIKRCANSVAQRSKA